jgi:hypothetical protein
MPKRIERTAATFVFASCWIQPSLNLRPIVGAGLYSDKHPTQLAELAVPAGRLDARILK